MISEDLTSSIKKVLIIRSCRMEQFYEALEILKERLGPDAIIDVLAQPGVKEELEANEKINEVLIYDKGLFKVKNISQELWKKIQANYDAFIILYGNTYWKTYHQINKIAALSKAKYIGGIDNEKKLFLVLRNLWWLKRSYNFILRIFVRVTTIIFKWLTTALVVSVVLVVRVLRPLVVIRFGHLYSNRIGHFAANTEVYLCERDAGIHGRRTIDIFYYRKDIPICNQQLKKMWDRTILTSRFAGLIDRVNRQLPEGEEHIIPCGNNGRDIHGLLAHTRPHLSFTSEEECLGQEALRKLGIPDGAPFICFYSRDSAYLEATYPNSQNWRYHDYRDSSIHNYVYAAEELTHRGYYAIRMGAIVKESLTTTNPRIIDYATNGSRTDFLDIYLCAKCSFFLGNPAGIIAIPMVFRRSIADVNVIPIEYVHSWNPNEISITKKLWLREEHRFLTFREILNSEIGRFFLVSNMNKWE